MNYSQAKQASCQPFFNRTKNTVIPNTHALQDSIRARGMDVIHARDVCPLEDGRDRSLSQKLLGWNNPVEDHPYQGYPAARWSHEGRLVVAWEDGRAGHTRLFHSGRATGKRFDPECQLNEHFECPLCEGFFFARNPGLIEVRQNAHNHKLPSLSAVHEPRVFKFQV